MRARAATGTDSAPLHYRSSQGFIKGQRPFESNSLPQPITTPSTVIRSFSYDAASRALTVVFRSGRRYAYNEVPLETSQAMQAAFSKNEFFNAHVRSHFRFIRNSARAT